MTIREKLHSIGIIPVIKIHDAEKAVPLARALYAGGLPAAEVTFRTEAAAEAIRRIREQVPEVCVCAGTVLNVETAERAVEPARRRSSARARTRRSWPGASKMGVPVIPGCATPTEVEACMRMGLDFVKLFPAEVVGGVAMLKALSGPYGGMAFMPTGGVNPRNAASYLAQKNVVCCGGSWMVPEKLLESGDFAAIEAACARSGGDRAEPVAREKRGLHLKTHESGQARLQGNPPAAAPVFSSGLRERGAGDDHPAPDAPVYVWNPKRNLRPRHRRILSTTRDKS